MTEPRERRSTRHSDSGPCVGISVQEPQIVEVARLELGTLFVACSFLQIVLVVEASEDEEVVGDLNGGVALSGTRNRSGALRLRPSHRFQVQYEDVVEEVVAVPASKDDHLRAFDKVGCVAEPRGGRSAAFGALQFAESTWNQVIEIGSKACRSL